MPDTKLDKSSVFCKQQRLVDKSGKPYLLVTGPVAVPNKLDTDQDWIEKEQIEQMAHEFMMSYQQHGYRHMQTVSKEEAVIVESVILRKETDYDGVVVPAGSWVITSRVYGELLIKGIEDGVIKGFSFGATGEYVDEMPPASAA